ncbi:uncharacterized protein LOC123308700 [Coccinella septempunctata]|uniref:uncharacterized protein LOC123308700 n=1 Tax=Coccinella septempunctata TaxID=41139 RepID=UPI001D080310|nr:uncharacterized protein LOC123308700 [Coccinella septempunctata]
MRKIKNNTTHKAVYWWTPDINRERKTCISLRRKLTRARKKANNTEDLPLWKKDRCWRELCCELENDIWGKAFQIVCRKFPRTAEKISRETAEAALKELFPIRAPFQRTTLPVEEFIPFTNEDIVAAASKLRKGKAPGMDGVPAEWKTAKLVLIRKSGGDADAPGKLRPISLVSSASKLMEQLILQRLRAEMEDGEDLSDRQFGFRPGRSTTDALLSVVRTARKVIESCYQHRGLCVLVTLDITKAFNAAEVLAYADDLAIIVRARDETSLKEKVEHAVELICSFLAGRELSIAAHKTEALLMVGRKHVKQLCFNIAGKEVRPSNQIKYLGVILDGQLSFKQHIRHISGKAKEKALTLSRIMPNIGRGGEFKRRVLGGVTNSIMLYAAPVWGTAMRVKAYRNTLRRVQRLTNLRICRGFRTISSEAAAVIASSCPIDLLVEERRSIYENPEVEKPEARRTTLRK